MHNDVKINGSNFVSIWSRLSASCSKQNFFNSWDSIAVVTFKWVTKHQNVCDGLGLGLIQSIMWQWAMKVQTFIYIFKQHEISSLDISSTNVPHLEALTNNSQHLKCESGMTPFKTIGEYPMPPLISCETTESTEVIAATEVIAGRNIEGSQFSELKIWFSPSIFLYNVLDGFRLFFSSNFAVVLFKFL